MIYLDNAATTGRKPQCVIDAVTDAMQNLNVNAGRGSYSLAREANELIEDCRNALLALAGIQSGYHVFFAPSATVAMNQIIHGLPVDSYSRIYVSPFEHNAVMRPVEELCRRTGARWLMLPFDKKTWALDEDTIQSDFARNKPDYVFISMVSNTTGYVLPVDRITMLAHQYGAKVIVDCAQAFGAVESAFSLINADAYVFAGHKTLLGPYGIAGMILSDRWALVNGLQGGTGSDSLNLHMPSRDAGGLEPGSQNIPAICGLRAAVKWLSERTVSAIASHERLLIDRFIEQISQNERVKLYLPPGTARSGIIAFNVEGYDSHDVGTILDDEFEVGVRTGYQCAPLVHDWLHTKEYGGIVRVSVSWFNTPDEINEISKAINTL